MNYAPYAAPQAPSSAYAEYRPLGGLTTATAVGILLSAGLGVIAFVVKSAYGNPKPGDLATLAIVGGAGLVHSLAVIAAAILFFLWVHRAASNVRVFGHEGLQFTPGWCVGWWFIPVVSYWQPYRAMKEIWRASAPSGVLASEDGGAWMTRGVPSTFPLWWLTYQGSGFFTLGAFLPAVSALIRHKPQPESPVLSGLGQLCVVMAGVAIISILRQLDRLQVASWEKVRSAADDS